MNPPLCIHGLGPAELVFVVSILAVMTNTIFKNRTMIHTKLIQYSKNLYRTPEVNRSKKISQIRSNKYQTMDSKHNKRPHYLPVLGDGFMRLDNF